MTTSPNFHERCERMERVAQSLATCAAVITEELTQMREAEARFAARTAKRNA